MNTQQTKWKTWHKVVLGVVVGFITLMIIAVNSDNSLNQKSEQAKTDKKEVAEIIISAAKLNIEYDDNEIAANQKYKNKIGKVSGKISDISTTFSDKPIISLSSGDAVMLLDIKCYLKDTSGMAFLHKGDIVTVQGKITGKTLGMVAIQHCVLIND